MKIKTLTHFMSFRRKAIIYIISKEIILNIIIFLLKEVYLI